MSGIKPILGFPKNSDGQKRDLPKIERTASGAYGLLVGPK